jgi:4-amino-4-deoxy-L-arabinose transferase-like glycosyltransferase
MDAMRARTHILLLLFAAFTIFFCNLGEPSLWDEDEPRNAGCAAEMIGRGDWVVPRFNGEIRTHKPVLLYWLMMSAYSVFGVNEFAARFWSALLGVGTVLLTYFIGRRLFGPRTGLFAGLVLASTIMFPVAARSATPDSTLVFLITAALAVFVAYTPRFNSSHRPDKLPPSPFPTDAWAVTAMYALMGLATLDKGPIGFLLPTAIIGMFLLIARLPSSEKIDRWWFRPLHPSHFLRTCRSMRLDLLVLCVLAVALPWYVWVTIRSDGEWTRGFFLEHNVGRAFYAMENHSGPPVYYLGALMVGFFPWSIFFLPFLIDLIRSCRSEHPYGDHRVFAVCWACVVVGLFTLASTKLPSYITPCFPGLAVLMGNFLDRLSTGKAKVGMFWPHVSYAVLGLTGLAIAIAIPIAATNFVPGIESLGSIGVILMIGALIAAGLWRRNHPVRSLQATFATASIFVTLLFGWGAAEVGKRQQIDRLMSTIKIRSDKPVIGSLGTMRSTWVFYSGTTVRRVTRDGGQEAIDFVAKSPDHFLIITDSEYDVVRDRLPDNVAVLRSVPQFLKPDQLLLVGQRRETKIARGIADQGIQSR